MRGTSTTKFRKDGEPKHAGNFSYWTVHHNSLQSKDWRVYLRDGQLIVGDHTPLEDVMPGIEYLAIRDPHFECYIQHGEKTVNGKKYEAHKRLTKSHVSHAYSYLNYAFIYREEIYTDGDFTYNFKEY